MIVGLNIACDSTAHICQTLVAIYNYGGSMYKYKCVEKFANMMNEKLWLNRHKPHWKECSLQYLSMRITQEKKELLAAIKQNKSKIEVLKEAADIANFALMIADNYKQQTTRRA